jgi:hypothetical protein
VLARDPLQVGRSRSAILHVRIYLLVPAHNIAGVPGPIVARLSLIFGPRQEPLERDRRRVRYPGRAQLASRKDVRCSAAVLQTCALEVRPNWSGGRGRRHEGVGWNNTADERVCE